MCTHARSRRSEAAKYPLAEPGLYCVRSSKRRRSFSKVHLIQPFIFLLLVADALTDYRLVPPGRGHEVTARPKARRRPRLSPRSGSNHAYAFLVLAGIVAAMVITWPVMKLGQLFSSRTRA
jgi:hypothetical protein